MCRVSYMGSRRDRIHCCKRRPYTSNVGTHQLVLVGGDGREDRLGEDVGAVLLLLQVGDGAAVLPPLDEVDAWLVPVHRVEHDLQQTTRRDYRVYE